MKNATEIREAISNYLYENGKMFLETRISLLIPGKNQSEIAFIFAEVRGKEGNKICCPTAIIVCNSLNASIISFNELDLPDEPAFLGTYKAVLPIEEQRTLFERLLEIYERIKEIAFIKKSKLCKNDMVILDEYKDIFNKLVPDCLKEAYFKIGSDFFQWLKQ